MACSSVAHIWKAVSTASAGEILGVLYPLIANRIVNAVSYWLLRVVAVSACVAAATGIATNAAVSKTIFVVNIAPSLSRKNHFRAGTVKQSSIHFVAEAGGASKVGH